MSHPRRSLHRSAVAVDGLSRGLVPAAFVAAALLAGCDWVDSTGRQAGDGSVPSPVALDQIAPGEALVVNERSAVRLDLASTANPDDVYAWSESPLDEGGLPSCAQVPGFRPELAATTLAEACTDAGACAFDFERDPSGSADATFEGDGGADGEDGDGAGGVAFVVAAPELRAPIGLRHELTVSDADGALVGTSVYDFCLVAINEAPDALDDGPFEVVEGTTLVVGADDRDNLLANDSDDEDVGNDELRVEIEPVRAPTASDAFELRADGGFSYTFAELGLRGTLADSFEYVVTDGVSTSSPAIVRLVIVPRDRPPFLERPLEPLEARVGEAFEADLAAGFSDPEERSLAFFPTGDSLPASGSLMLEESGLLSGTPLPEDVGDYDVRFVASDGVRETEASVALAIVEPPNAAPRYVAGTIDDIVLVRNRFMTPRTAEFEDPEGEPLEFELIGELPIGLRFDTETGTLSGRPTRQGTVFGLRVVATDPEGASARSVPFSIRVIR